MQETMAQKIQLQADDSGAFAFFWRVSWLLFQKYNKIYMDK